MLGSLVITYITRTGEQQQFNSTIDYYVERIQQDVDNLIDHYKLNRQHIKCITFTAHPIPIALEWRIP